MAIQLVIATTTQVVAASAKQPQPILLASVDIRVHGHARDLLCTVLTLTLQTANVLTEVYSLVWKAEETAWDTILMIVIVIIKAVDVLFRKCLQEGLLASVITRASGRVEGMWCSVLSTTTTTARILIVPGTLVFKEEGTVGDIR